MNVDVSTIPDLPSRDRQLIVEIVQAEVTHALALLDMDASFDSLADAAATLTAAADRLAPEGHRVRFQRETR